MTMSWMLCRYAQHVPFNNQALVKHTEENVLIEEASICTEPTPERSAASYVIYNMSSTLMIIVKLVSLRTAHSI